MRDIIPLEFSLCVSYSGGPHVSVCKFCILKLVAKFTFLCQKGRVFPSLGSVFVFRGYPWYNIYWIQTYQHIVMKMVFYERVMNSLLAGIYIISIVHLWITWSVHKRTGLFPFFVLCILWILLFYILERNLWTPRREIYIFWKRNTPTFIWLAYILNKVPLDHAICLRTKGYFPSLFSVFCVFTVCLW